MTTSALSFGSLSTSGGTPRLSGTASKLDTEAILQATYEAKRLPAVRLEQRTAANDAKMAAYEDMRLLLDNLRSAAEGLRNPPGFLGAQNNVFETKQAFFSSSSAVPPNQLIAVSAANTAEPGSFDLTVKQLATAAKLATPSTTAADQRLGDAWNGGAAFAGTLEIGLAGGPTATIAVDDDMTIYQLRDRINAERSTTGVRASVLKVAENDFRLVMTAEETGKAITVTDSTGIAGGFATTSLQEARPAIVEIDNVEITRSSNQLTDLLPGVTIDLFKGDENTTITVTIEPSLGDIKERIGSFVAAYNSFRDFVTTQSAVDGNGRPLPDAVLFGDRTMRGAVTGLGGIVGAGVTGLDAQAINTLRGIGIEIGPDSRMRVDDSKLDNALLTKLDDVRGIFEFRFTASSPTIAVMARSNNLTVNALQIAITDTNSDGQPEGVTINGFAAQVSGSTIRGAEGTPFEGLELIWTGNGSMTIDLEFSQGIADRVFNFVGPTTNRANGSITRAVENLKEVNGNFAKQIERIEERAVRARELLLERFSAMEAALSMAEMMMNQIRAQVDAMTADR